MLVTIHDMKGNTMILQLYPLSFQTLLQDLHSKRGSIQQSMNDSPEASVESDFHCIVTYLFIHLNLIFGKLRHCDLKEKNNA